jgi:hypothetical protein
VGKLVRKHTHYAHKEEPRLRFFFCGYRAGLCRNSSPIHWDLFLFLMGKSEPELRTIGDTKRTRMKQGFGFIASFARGRGTLARGPTDATHQARDPQGQNRSPKTNA